MRLTNARHSIHDAFAIHLGGPKDNTGGGVTKFNSTKWLQTAGTAGLVIRAVMDQPAHLRGVAIFMNAPENTISLADLIALKTAAWSLFIRKHPATTPDDQGVIIAYIDRILLGYRSRVWDNRSDLHTAGRMFAHYSAERAARLSDLANALIDIVADMDNKSLGPVWAVIDSEREAERKVANA